MTKSAKKFASLWIDTSGANIVLKLELNGQVIDEVKEEADKKQSELLLIEIDKLLKKHNLKLNELDKIKAHSGPGRFTSLRVGIATVNGLNFALGRNDFIKPNYGNKLNIILKN